jgi:hypothetical protein
MSKIAEKRTEEQGTQPPRGWVPAKPCPVCGKTDSTWCSQTLDGKVICCRFREDGCYASREDCNGSPYYLHTHDGEPPDWGSYRAQTAVRASPKWLHDVYCTLLETLELSPEHRENLRKRGLTDEQIDKRMFRTLPKQGRKDIAEKVLEDSFVTASREKREKALLKVPGFVLRGEGEDQYLTIAGPSGLLLPVHREDAHIVALKIRCDDPGDGPKYLYLSSTKDGGPGPGSPYHLSSLFRGSACPDEIRIAEGELKADVAAAITGLPTIGIPGASVWRPAVAWAQLFGIKAVRLAYDADAREKEHVAAALSACAGAVQEAGMTLKLEVWDKADGKGIDDLLAAGKEPTVLEGDEAMAEVEKIAREAGARTDEPEAEDDRPTIIESTEEHKVNDEAVAALSRDSSIYQRAGLLVRVVEDASPAAKGVRRRFAPRIEPLPQALLRERFTANARWVRLKQTPKGPAFCPGHPPGWCVAAVHARSQWAGINYLEAVVDYPVLRPDGTVLSKPGYDRDTGLLYRRRGKAIELLDSPSKEDAIRARDELLEIVGDFPFAAEAHKAAWLAAQLTPLARFSFAGPAPLFLCEANVPGAGKGLALDCIAIVTTGERFTIGTYTDDDEELRKRITSLALGGERLVLFDNLIGSFGNATLDAAVTGTAWEDRILTTNKVARLPLSITWYATGNNVAIRRDISRRICHIRLESPQERPEERTGFKHPNLIQYVRRRRPKLLAAALTILRGYCVAGRPDMQLSAWGSFEDWSSLVRSAVVWVGMPDPGETRLLLRQSADTATESMALLLAGWEKMDPKRRGLTAAEVIHRLFGEDQRFVVPEHYRDMRAAIESLLGKGDTRGLGYKLREYQRRPIGGRYIDRAGEKDHSIRWAVYPATELQPGGKHPPNVPHPPSLAEEETGDAGETGDASPQGPNRSQRKRPRDGSDGQRQVGKPARGETSPGSPSSPVGRQRHQSNGRVEL